MHSFNPTEHGVGECVRTLLRLISSRIADMSVTPDYAPLPKYDIRLSGDFDNLTLVIPATPYDPDNTMTILYSYSSRALHVNIDKIQHTFVMSLIEQTRPDSRCINEEVLISLMVIQQLLIEIIHKRLIPRNPKDICDVR